MAYASLEDLANRLSWEMSEDEERIAESALEDASDLVRAYGRDWTEESPPRLIVTLVLKAVVRYLKNPEGFTQSRSGDETVIWSDEAGRDLGEVHFTRDEIRLIEGLAGRRPALMSAPLYAWGTKDVVDDGYRPTSNGKPFPMFDVGGESW